MNEPKLDTSRITNELIAWRDLGKDAYRTPANPTASVTAPWQRVTNGLQAPVQAWGGFVKPKPVRVEKVVDYARAIPSRATRSISPKPIEFLDAPTKQ